jgi:MFS superfamily sulfate permease-like transporter
MKTINTGLLPGTDIYSDLKRHKRITAVNGVRIFRFDAPLMFINTELFRQRLYEECKSHSML